MIEPLVDGHGRRISDLRVSVTDRCNFRCQYCMPADGLPWLDRAEVLRFEEIERLVRVFAAMGVNDAAPDRRRAARAPRASRGSWRCWRRRRHRRPLAHDERLPAGARRRRAGRGGHPSRERLDRLAPARPLLRDHPPRLAAAGAARPRRARAPPPGASDQGQRGGAARLHRAGGAAVRGVRAQHARSRCASSSSCRSTPTTPGRSDEVLTGEEIRAIIAATHPLEELPREPSVHRARLPLRRRHAARSASSTRCPSRSARTATASG